MIAGSMLSFRTIPILLLLLAMLTEAFPQPASDILRWVDPMIGTGGHGHTFPGATLPFGMVQLSPDTRTEGWDACGGYHYSDTSVLGFSHTHLSGTGIADYGDILVTPTSGRINRNRDSYTFRHVNEVASPGYYSVLLDNGISVELSATSRTGVHKYIFDSKDTANILIDLRHGLGPDNVIESHCSVDGDREISGVRRSSGWAKDQHVYFVAQFSSPFSSFGMIKGDTIQRGFRRAEGKDVRCFLQFAAGSPREIMVKVGISSVSIGNARRNLESEAPGWNFSHVRAEAAEAWHDALSRIEIEGGDERTLRVFYTALYHAMIAPNVQSDVDGSYRGMDGRIRTANGFTMYTVFSLWDTFRAEHPLLAIIDRKRTTDFIRSLLAKYDESGVLPVWELSSNETWTMIGYHAVPVIVDAYVKGIRDFDAAKAFEAMKKSASLDHFGLDGYRRFGYVPGELEGESVSKTLEYAYDDWCVAQMALALGKHQEADHFLRRAQSYKNVFDPATRYMRPKENGAWVEPFDPRSVTVHFTEANACQYNFFVPHDIPGLVDLFGGSENFGIRLDSLFFGNSQLTGRDQADITGLIGQYAQGNEPSHNFAYLYNYVDEPWKTAKVVRLIMDSLYTDAPDGLCGNDDCGQMSAWYVMSALGFYPVTPGSPEYSIGSPIFPRATIRLEHGSKFTIEAASSSKTNMFIDSATLNGNNHSTTVLLHSDVQRGGTLSFTMSPRPSRSWGKDPDRTSQPAAGFVPVPFVESGQRSFIDSTVVRLATIDASSSIWYRFKNLNADEPFIQYSGPILVQRDATLQARAISPLGISDTVEALFVRRVPVGRLSLRSSYSPQYAGGGDEALVDGLKGGLNFRLGAWQGYEGIDLDAVIDLGSVRTIGSVSLGCLQDNNSWIFFPSTVEFLFSDDGKLFIDSVAIGNSVSPRSEHPQRKEFTANDGTRRARYIRVRAQNIRTCPEWHKGAGGKAWLFVDEISVRTIP